MSRLSNLLVQQHYADLLCGFATTTVIESETAGYHSMT